MATPSRPKRVTIADVAREAGVSRTTVSHALNDMGQVDPRTRERVKRVAAELNYRPSVRAQRLRSGRSQALALLSSMSPAVSAGPAQLGFFTELAMGCAQTALLRGYVLALAPPLDGTNPVERLDIDGAILLEPLPHDPIASELRDRGIPFVTIDDPLTPGGQGEVGSVSLHHVQTAELLICHLLDRGADRLGLVVGDSGRRSQVVFEETFRRIAPEWAGSPLILRVPESRGEEGGRDAAARLLREFPDLNGICAPIDAFAVGAVGAATSAGRAVGRDLLVATRYDGIRAQTSAPPLTSVDLHLHDVSRRAVDLLLNALGAPRSDHDAATPGPPTLIPRESTMGEGAA